MCLKKAPHSKAVVVNYTYDKLERVASVNYDDTDTTYGYHYSSDGSLAGITVNGAPAYDYTYDSLGRLIYSAKLQDKRPVLYTSHQYDTSNRLTEQNWQIGSDSFSESYTYNQNDGTLTSMTSGGDTLAFSYNNLKQLSGRTSPKLDMAYTYRTWTDTQNKQWQTNQVASVQYLKHGTSTQLLPVLNYSYDSVGNIAQIKENSSNVAQYSYDAQNQVTKEILPSQTSDYTYDTYGNIRSKKTTYSNGTYEQYTYTYGNAAWKDQLSTISYRDTNGNVHNGNFSYDIVGNPLTYNNGKNNWTFTWKHGRQLATATDGTTTITNTYDVDGIRDSKTVGNVKHTYTTLSGKIVREAYGENVIDYFYDQDGRPYKFVVKAGSASPVTGYFVLNLQGDVIAIIDATGAVVVEYQYNAWGKEISHTTAGNSGSTLYAHNALKYRGYYYDADLGLYYLNHRLYDAEIGRFINADTIDILAVEQGDLLQYNLYTYCFNNPLKYYDEQGTLAVKACIVGASVLSSWIAAAVTGQEYTLGDAAVTAISTAVGLIYSDTIFLSAFMSSSVTIIASKLSGKTTKTAIQDGVSAAISCLVTVNTLVSFSGANINQTLQVVNDFVYGTPMNMFSNIAIDYLNNNDNNKNVTTNTSAVSVHKTYAYKNIHKKNKVNSVRV